MPRATREQQARNHDRVIQEASRSIRELGVDGVSIPGVMAAAGLTHGGFYKHFASKEDLLVQAEKAAFAERLETLTGLARTAPDAAAARAEFIDGYLSAGHRDDPGTGCAGVALAAGVSHRSPDDPLRRAYVDGLREMIGALDSQRPGAVAGQPDPQALVELALLVGGVVLARATAGDDISDRILGAVRQQLVGD